jgi:hypothetical protein
MNLRAWMGLGLVVAYLGGGYLRITAPRRSGARQSFSHPVLDNVLLLISGLLLAAALGLAVCLFTIKPHGVEARFVRLPTSADAGRPFDMVLHCDSPPREEMKASLADNLSGLDRTSKVFRFHSFIV